MTNASWFSFLLGSFFGAFLAIVQRGAKEKISLLIGGGFFAPGDCLKALDSQFKKGLTGLCRFCRKNERPLTFRTTVDSRAFSRVRDIKTMSFISAFQPLSKPSRRTWPSSRIEEPQCVSCRMIPFSVDATLGQLDFTLPRTLVEISLCNRFESSWTLEYHLTNRTDPLEIQTIRPYPVNTHVANQKHP